MNIFKLTPTVLETWVTGYTGVVFKKDQCYQDGCWKESWGMDRLVSEPVRYWVGKSFFDALPEYGFVSLPPAARVGVHVYQPNVPYRSCWVARDESKRNALNLIVACELSQDRTQVTFSPHVRYIHHNVGDHESERRRGTNLDPLFPILARYGGPVKKVNVPFLDRVIRDGVFRVSLKEMGHHIQLLTSLFQEFTGGNADFRTIVDKFNPIPEKDVIVEVETGVREDVLSRWGKQLEAFKARLKPAV